MSHDRGCPCGLDKGEYNNCQKSLSECYRADVRLMLGTGNAIDKTPFTERKLGSVPLQTKMKRCPMCGSEAIMTVNRFGALVPPQRYSVKCGASCGMVLDVRSRTEAEAVVAWNTRADE